MVQLFNSIHEMRVDGGAFERLVFALIHDKPSEFKLKIHAGDDSHQNLEFSGKETFVKEFAGKTNTTFILAKTEIEAEKLVIHKPLSTSYPDVDGMLEFIDNKKKYLVFFQTTFQTPQEHTNNESRRFFFELEDNQYLALDDKHLNTRKLNKHDKVQCFKIYQRFIKETNKNHPNHNSNDLEELKSFLEAVDEDQQKDKKDEDQQQDQQQDKKDEDQQQDKKDEEDEKNKLRELIKKEFVLGGNEEFGQEENEIKKIFDIKKDSKLEKKWERVNTFLRDVKKEKRALELKKHVRLEDYETYFVWISPPYNEKKPVYKSKNGKLKGLGLRQSVMCINRIHDDLKGKFSKE